MNITGLKLIRILVIVNMFYSLTLKAEKETSTSTTSSSLDRFLSQQNNGCDSNSPNYAACVKAEKARYLKEEKEYANDEVERKKNVCKDIKDDYSEAVSQIQEGCKPTGLKFTECVEKARSCNSGQSAAMQSLAGFASGMATSSCSTKEAADHNRDQQEKQQEDLKDTQKDISEKYSEAQDQLQEAMSSEFSTLMEISQKNKEMRDESLDTANSAQTIERQMRRKLMASLQSYHQGQQTVAKLNRNLVSLTAKMGELPKNYMNDCLTNAKNDQKQGQRALQQMSSELSGNLKEVSSSGSTTISAYTYEQNAAKKKYNDAKKNLEQDLKDNYQSCLKQKQTAYAAEYEALKAQIDDNQDQINSLQDQVDGVRISMQEDLRESQQEKNFVVNKSQSSMQARGEDINLVRMQHNVELNAAMQRVQAVQAEMTQFQTQAESKMRMNMMSSMMGMLTGSGNAGLGDVLPYIDEYDNYQDELKDAGCTGKSKSGRSKSGGDGQN